MQQVVECYNRKGKTALQLGIENNCTGFVNRFLFTSVTKFRSVESKQHAPRSS